MFLKTLSRLQRVFYSLGIVSSIITIVTTLTFIGVSGVAARKAKKVEQKLTTSGTLNKLYDNFNKLILNVE